MAREALRPTLWRTCRVLASKPRLRAFQWVLERPGQTVSAVARRFKIPLPAASESLRALEARGLLVSRRAGRFVEYRLGSESDGRFAGGLVRALRAELERASDATTTLAKLATAFTHSRRIEIYRALAAGPLNFRELRAATRISARALSRHLRKLRQRGFVDLDPQPEVQRYRVVMRRDAYGRELARLAAAS